MYTYADKIRQRMFCYTIKNEEVYELFRHPSYKHQFTYT
jgi:hypothetical protein